MLITGLMRDEIGLSYGGYSQLAFLCFFDLDEMSVFTLNCLKNHRRLADVGDP
jgi:hypothetical protein